MSIELIGNWKKGFAFDVHTLSSVYLGVNEQGYEQWENTRSEMGELLYHLKYKSDRSIVDNIVRLLEKIKGIETMDCIIPIPSTKKTRPYQPVLVIAQSLGKHRGVEILENVLINTDGDELKNIEDPNERTAILEKHLKILDTVNIKGKNVLLLDDLYRSGATLSAATNLLYNVGQAKGVYVLTMTKTRSKR